jgi:hypothetical protein
MYLFVYVASLFGGFLARFNGVFSFGDSPFEPSGDERSQVG